MSPVQTEQLRLITVGWAQADRRCDLLVWHSHTAMLNDKACNAARSALCDEDHDFAADLYTLAGLSYQRSIEYMPPDLCLLPNLIYATA